MMQFIFRVWLKMLKEWWQLTVPIRLHAQGVELGVGCQFYGMPIVGVAAGSRIRLGDRVVLCSDSRFTALGVDHPVVLRTLRPGAEIVIGNDCGISGGSICAAIRVELGAECLLGANVTLADTDFHPTNADGRRYNKNPQEIAAAPVKISSNVFIGTRAMVLKGVCVGRNSVIGAGSIVIRSLPPDVVSAGSPAKVVKAL
jgi:acetyltransferase-like isoleucine patch superfamily enzyme